MKMSCCLDCSNLNMTQSTIRPHHDWITSTTIASEALPEKVLVSAITAAELSAAQDRYQYNYSHIAPVAMVDRLPKEEMPSICWWRKVLKIMGSILVNAAVVRHGHDELEAQEHVTGLLTQSLFDIFRKSSTKIRLKVLWQLLKISPSLILKGFKFSMGDFESLIHNLVMTLEHDLVKMLHLGVKDQISISKPHHSEDCADCLSKYDKQFATLELPAIAEYFHEDKCFANFRVAGPNPLMLERVTGQDGNVLHANFPVTNEHYQAVMGTSDSLELAIAEGRLYLADYAILNGALNGSYPDYQKYIDAPLALFAVPQSGQESRHLHAVAIQCKQNPSQDNPIFTPAPNGTKEAAYGWEMAKRVVQVADSNFHEAVTHLGRTHLFMSPFILATHRQLPKSHPISTLLRPHFEGTLSINHGAHKFLIAPQGGVDGILAATIDCARILAATGACSHGFNNAMLPNQLKSRGLDDPDTLPHYPYRDDAILLWDAIQGWVSDYVSHYYASDQAVIEDQHLQAWAKEIQAFDGGRVQDFGEDGKLRTCAYLIQALTLLIFTASAQHAAVNFPQGDMMVYPPAMPLAAYQPAPTQTEMSHDDELTQLPPMHQSLEQIELTYLLGQVYHTQLGYYPEGHFEDEKIKGCLQNFQHRLADIETIIDERNESRPYPYPYLKPSRIPQSINI